MKTKRNIIALYTLCTALSITGCAGQETSKTENTQNTAAVSASESSADDSNVALDDLYQQENQIFADHKDVWDKVFGMMNKVLLIQMEIMLIILLILSKQTRLRLQTAS